MWKFTHNNAVPVVDIEQILGLSVRYGLMYRSMLTYISDATLPALVENLACLPKPCKTQLWS